MWQTWLGAVLGAAVGFVGGRLAPRWLPVPVRSWEPLLMAGVTALLGGLLASQSGGVGRFFWHQLFFFGILVTASVVDLHEKIIPNELVLAGVGVGLALLLLPYAGKSWDQALIGMAIGFGSLLVMALIVRGGMGMGDVKLAAVIGLFAGYPSIVMSLLLAFVLGGLVGVLLLLFRIVGRKDMIPFGPYLALGAIITILYGPSIMEWYNP